MLAGAKAQSCVNCGVSDGTVVAAHYNGMRSHLFGRGTGHKPHDLCVADLCARCHRKFDMEFETDTFEKKIDKSEQFLFLIIKTLLRRISQDIVKVKGYDNE
jgi:hypothetical protein